MEQNRQQRQLQPVKKRKRITATSESEDDTSSKNNEQQNNKKHSSDVEIMNLSTSITPKSSAPPPSHPNSTIETGTKNPTNPPENTAQEPSTPLNQTTDQSPIQSNSLSQALKDNFTFLILKGPGFFSNHQALKKMVESAQTFLEEEPDEAIYQLELDEKSSQLKQSEESLDAELNTAAEPIVQALTQFIQSLLERELKLKLDQAIRAHTVRQEKKFDKKLSQFKSKPSTDSSLPPPPPLSSSVTAEKIEDIENSLATLTATIDKLDATKVDRKLQDFEKSAQSQAEIQSKQIQQLQAQLKEIQQTHKTQLDQLQSKLIAMEANQPKKRLTDNRSTEPPSGQSNSNSRVASPENTRTTTSNSLKLNLSPKVSSTSTTTPQPKQCHRSASQSQPQPQPQSKPTHPSVGNSNHSTVNPPTRNNSNTNQTRPHPIKIPNRTSAEPATSSPRTSNTLPSNEPLPSDSPVNTNHQSLSHPVSAEAYNHICARLMKSTWLLDFTKSISTEMYKQFIHQDLTTHLDQLGLTPQRISDLVNLLNLLSELDLNFLSTKPSSALTITTIPPPNNPNTPTTHPLPQPPNLIATHPLPQPPNLIANNPIHPPASLPTNFNMVENFSLAYLKDVLGVIQYNVQFLENRLDRSEIRISNAERIGIKENAHVLNLIQRLEFTEAQISQLANSKAASEELLALQTRMEARVMSTQREINDSLTAFWEETTSKIQSLQHHTPRSTSLSLPGHPHTPSTTQKNVHQSCLSMTKVENHILDRLFFELSPFFTPPGSNDSAPKELKPKPIERPRRELEEGETSGDDDESDTIKSFPTIGDRTTDSSSSKSENPSTRWKALIGSLSAKYQEQLKSSDKKVLVHEHQHHHHQHHHHHHHQRVRLVLAADKPSQIDSLKVDKQVERAVMSQSAEELALEQHHEELEALAQTSCTNPTVPSTSAQSSSIPNPPAPANPSSHPTSD